MVFPLLKVGSLLVKSLAKPLSKQIKDRVNKSPVWHDRVVRGARLWHRLDLKLTKFSGDNSRKPTDLNVNAAIALGSEIVSEAFLLSVAVGLLLYETSRSSEKDKKKEETLQNRFKRLEEKTEIQQETINNLTNVIQAIQSSNPNLNIYINDPSQSSTKTLTEYINNQNPNPLNIATENDYKSLSNEGIPNKISNVN
ncbi:hypothetical protein RB653_000929 [Dictyostelium firmibasis]|uniref:OPA3-like protein n=1 Tax=Dictyostelium firmibasis TaxID=79012 RepID=A0AAN7U7K4_9MYCE